MGGNYVTDPLVFLIHALFSLYILAVMLRFLLQWLRADFYNPFSQFLVKITHPPLRFMRGFIPSVGRIDSSSLLLAFLLQIIEKFAILAIKGLSIGFAAVMLLSFADLLEMILDIFVFAIVAAALLSWFAAGGYSAAASLLFSLTEPMLSVCRRLIPDMGGVDLSPLLALLLLQLAKMMVLPPLLQLAGLLG